MTPKSKDLSRRQAEEFARLFESLQIGEVTYAPEMTTMFGEAVEEPYVPARDYSVPWQTGKSTDPQPGQAMPTPTGIQSTGSFTAPEEGAKTYVGRSMGRDNEWWDLKRPTIGLKDAWIGGVDVLLSDPSYTYSAENPYVYTDEMRAADEARAAELDASMYYDPVTDTTTRYGFTMKGDHTQGKTQADYSPEDWQYLQNDRYYEGFDQFTPEGIAALKAAGGTNTLRWSHFDHDVNAALDYLRDKSKGYNPFYGDRGRVAQGMIDRSRELGHIDDKLTAYEKRSDNNAMDYLYSKLGTTDQVGNRKEAYNRWNKYLEDMNLSTENFYNVKMNKNLFNRLGLSDFGLEFDESFGGGSGMMGGSGFKMPDRYQTDGGSSTFNGGSAGSSSSNANTRGNFMEAYMKEREKEKEKTSVASLFDEMENFK